MLVELRRRHYSPDTIRGYVHAVEQFATYFHKSPELLGLEEIGDFQLHLLEEKQLAIGTIALRMGALRFLYKRVLKRRDLDFENLPLLRTPKKLPVILSPEEVTRLIEAAPNLLYRTLLMLLYATGLRRTEAATLKVADIDSSLMLIHVHQGKGARDRELPLTQKLLDALRQYWRACTIKPRVYLFPQPLGRDGGRKAHLRQNSMERMSRSSTSRWHHQTPWTAHASALLRHSHARGRHRPAHDSTTPRTPAIEGDGHLSALVAPAFAGRHQSS
jgi:integrase